MYVIYKNKKLEIPDFLKSGKLYKGLDHDDNSLFPVLYYAKNDIVNNINDFINLINVCNYWFIDYDFHNQENFIESNISDILYSLKYHFQNYDFPFQILELCLNYCKIEDFPILYEFYNLIEKQDYRIINYIRKNPEVILYCLTAGMSISNEDVNLALNINLYIDLLENFHRYNMDENLSPSKKYPFLNRGIVNIKNSLVISSIIYNNLISYLITLINNLNMNYKIIYNDNTTTLFEHFVFKLNYITGYLKSGCKENKSSFVPIKSNDYAGKYIINFTTDIVDSDIFYALKSKNEIDYIENISLLTPNFDSSLDDLSLAFALNGSRACFLHYLLKDNEELLNYLNINYNWNYIFPFYNVYENTEYNYDNYMSMFKYCVTEGFN